MPTIKEKLYFNFDGESSRDYNLVHVNLDSGMYVDTLVANRSILENELRGANKPKFIGIDESPSTITMNLAFDKKYTDTDLDNVVRWLFKKDYRPLYFEGNDNKVFYCIAEGESTITHTGLKEGYITVNMRCDSHNVYSPTYLSQRIYIDSATAKKTIELYNEGHHDIYPEISIQKIDGGTVRITNKSDGGSLLSISNLTNQEEIYINCEKEIVETDLMGTYRYNDVNGEFIRLKYGKNILEITGKCYIQFRYRNRYLF